MPQPKKNAASPSKGEAAVAEVTGQAKTVTFRDATLALPAELPPTLLFDITEMEAAGDNPMPVFRLLRSVLGPEQFTEVRNLLRPDDDVGEVIIDGLFGELLEQYGVGLGNSSASEAS